MEDDVEIIKKKLRGEPIDPPDHREVDQIFQGLSENDKSRLFTDVVNEEMTKKLWEEIKTPNNRKDLIKAGLKDQKSRKLLDLWDKVKNERDFILKKMDEISENEIQAKQGFDKFTKDYLKKNNPGKNIDFEWRDLSQYTLTYHEFSDIPEHIKVTYNDGKILILPLIHLPEGLQKILVSREDIQYTNNQGGKFIVNIKDIYPTTGGDEEKWVVKGFKDLASNPYDVEILFGSEKSGTIKTTEGGFIIKNKASVIIDNKKSAYHNLRELEEKKEGFITIHEIGIYLFGGEINTLYGLNIKTNISELCIDDDGVMTDFSQSTLQIPQFEKKILRIKDDQEYPNQKLLTGNFELTKGRRFTINSDDGIDFEFTLMSEEVHSGHLIKDNSLVFQHGFINTQRIQPGASDVLNEYTRIGTTLVDINKKRGSFNMGKQFVDYFSEIHSIIDRILNYTLKKQFINKEGYFG
jgi:hypothetical protein